MNSSRRVLELLVVSVLVCAPRVVAQAETVTWNVNTKYGVTAAGIRKAVDDARAHFKAHPNDTIELVFDMGSYYLEDDTPQEGTIDLTGIKPGPRGRLVFRGAGIDKTVLVFRDDKHAIAGRRVHRVTFADMHMTRRHYTVSQGHVVEVAKGAITLEIQDGFPTPLDIFDAGSDQGRYLRRYTDSRNDPQLIQDDNEQIAWKAATHVGGRWWKLELVNRNLVANYAAGDLVGIKSKHGGQTYWFFGGSDFRFERVKWTHKTRGVFRGGFDRVHVIDCVTDRAAPINGQTPCLAAPGGGPQIGQPDDPRTGGHLVKGCRFIASGDDAVGLFNVSGEVRDCYMADAFARGILLANSPDVVLANNTLVRCPIQKGEDYRLPINQGRQPGK